MSSSAFVAIKLLLLFLCLMSSNISFHIYILCFLSVFKCVLFSQFWFPLCEDYLVLNFFFINFKIIAVLLAIIISFMLFVKIWFHL